MVQKMKRLATVVTGGLTADPGHPTPVTPLKNTCAVLLSRWPSGAATSPDPGSNDSPLPQSTDTENVTELVGPPVTANGPGKVQRRAMGGPMIGSQP